MKIINNIINYIKMHKYLVIMILLFIIKYIIVDAQIIYYKGYTHDDLYYLNAASAFASNNWLGPYNDYILSKGITGIVFIGIIKIFGLSYLKTQTILYFLACLSIINMLKNFNIANKKLLIIYILLLFNPISFSDTFSFVYRDGIYTILLMFLVSYSFQVFFNKDKYIKKYIEYTILYSLIITPILLCREETICVLPYIIISILLTIIFILFNKKNDYKLLRILLLIVLPIVVYTTTTGIISYNNNKYYKRYIINDFTTKDFKDLYGSLTRIKQDNYLLRIPLNKETRLQIYELSPTFKELESYLESDDFSKYRRNEYDDYAEGFLYWAVRDAAYQLGYYKDASTAYEFNVRLTKEIDDLCDNKKIDCYPKRSSLVAPFNKELYNEMKVYIPNAFITQITYDKILIRWSNKKTYTLVKDVTKDNTLYRNEDDIRLSLMDQILNLYKVFNPILVILSIFYLILVIINIIRYKLFNNYIDYHIFILGLLGLYLLRVIAVGIVAATEYSTALDKAQYLSSIYNIQLLLSMIIIILYYKIKIDIKKK